MNDQNFVAYTHPQFGSGLAYYRPTVLRQRGSGLGGIFGSVIRSLIPFTRKYILPAAKKFVLPHAEEAIGRITGDIINGRTNIRDSIKSNSMTALRKIGKSVLDQSGNGRPRKRKHSTANTFPDEIPKTKKSKTKISKKKEQRITIF